MVTDKSSVCTVRVQVGNSTILIQQKGTNGSTVNFATVRVWQGVQNVMVTGNSYKGDES